MTLGNTPEKGLFRERIRSQPPRQERVKFPKDMASIDLPKLLVTTGACISFVADGRTFSQRFDSQSKLDCMTAIGSLSAPISEWLEPLLVTTPFSVCCHYFLSPLYPFRHQTT